VSAAEGLLEPGLARALVLVDDAALAARYRDALAALGARAPVCARFHVDAAGWSPEVADELADPFYLGGGPLEARAVVLGAAQLAAPLVHPGLGFAAGAFRALARERARELAALTLREPVLLDAAPLPGPLSKPAELADPDRFELLLRTPSGILEASRRFEGMKGEFLESERRWLQDDFIAELLALAARVRELPPMPEGFEASRHRLAPVFFSPAFGGAYVIEEPGASLAAATTWVLAGDVPVARDAGTAGAREARAEPRQAPAPRPAGAAALRSARERRVELRPLAPEAALEALERHRIARVDLGAWRGESDALAELRHWLALEAALARDPEGVPAPFGRHEVADLLDDCGDLPPEARELAEVSRRLLSGRGGVDPDALSPLARLRLAVPASRRPEVSRFVRHVQAFFWPLDLALAWRAAPDLLFARLPRLGAARRAYLARWVAEARGEEE
jgi:hypothetical protein